MIQTIRNAWGIPRTAQKDRVYRLILLIFRIGNAIPVPMWTPTLLDDYINA